MNEQMKAHLVDVRGLLIKTVRELASHRMREIRELGIARSKNTPLKFFIRVMVDEIRRISSIEEIGPVRPVISGGTEPSHVERPARHGKFQEAEAILAGEKSVEELTAFRELMLEHIHRFLAMPQFTEESHVVVGFRLLVDAIEARIRFKEFLGLQELAEPAASR